MALVVPRFHGMLAGMQARRKNFHLPLDPALHDRLRREALRSGRPATELAREAIEAALAERARMVLHEAIADYAVATAGTEADLNPELERAATEHLLAIRKAPTERPRSSQELTPAARARASRGARKRRRS